jgi:F-type H+-transporting ATPase subunit b
MLQIDALWFFVQLVNFLALLILLNYILFRPLLRLFKDRDTRINGSLDDAKNMDKERDDLTTQIESKISEARNTARELFEGLSKEGLEAQRESLNKASQEASDISRKAGEDLQGEMKKTKESLRSKVEAFSKIIVEKMIGA